MRSIEIIDRGRGPELAGTRITVYDVIPYLEAGHSTFAIAAVLRISSPAVEALIRYLADHKDEIMVVQQQIEERSARGNPQDVEQKFQTSRAKLCRQAEEVRRGNGQQAKTSAGLLVDEDSRGHVLTLAQILECGPWRTLWEQFHPSVLLLRDLELSPDIDDATLWQACQDENLMLLTAGRNADGPGSLEATLAVTRRPDSLPVLILSHPERLEEHQEYSQGVVERLLELLVDSDRYRGTGQIDLS